MDGSDRFFPRPGKANIWVHGDAHNNNMLNVPGTKHYKSIDPCGHFLKKNYDVGVLMREWPEEYAPNPLEKGR